VLLEIDFFSGSYGKKKEKSKSIQNLNPIKILFECNK